MLEIGHVCINKQACPLHSCCPIGKLFFYYSGKSFFTKHSNAVRLTPGNKENKQRKLGNTAWISHLRANSALNLCFAHSCVGTVSGSLCFGFPFIADYIAK